MEELTVDELIDSLKKLSYEGRGDLKVRFYEKGSAHDKPVMKAYKKENNVILSDYIEKPKKKLPVDLKSIIKLVKFNLHHSAGTNEGDLFLNELIQIISDFEEEYPADSRADKQE